MCRMKSAIILKDRVFIPDYDSHTDMLEELGIEDTTENAQRLFVRAELSPTNEDVFSDIDTWNFNVDQDIVPEWFVAEYEKQRMIQAVKEWAKGRIHIGKDGLKVSEGRMHYIKDCKNVEIYDSASVKNICGSASVENIYGSASVEYICGSASVENIYGSASVENIYDSASVKNICGSASVKNICGSASVKNIYGSASVEYICGSASVKNIYGSASVENIYDSASVEKASGNATIITSKYSKWNNQEKMLLLENSTLKDNYHKVIYQSGDYKLVSVTDGKVQNGN